MGRGELCCPVDMLFENVQLSISVHTDSNSNETIYRKTRSESLKMNGL